MELQDDLEGGISFVFEKRKKNTVKKFIFPAFTKKYISIYR